MLSIRRADERGKADFGWLKSRHSFSFGGYLDANHMGFGPLRVINEDRVAPGAGFGEHEHANMEIISVVLDGTLEHKDSLGQSAVVRPGEVQRMTAGTGVRHSEYNASRTDPVHFLQIWIVPDRDGLTPGYEQKQFTTGPNALTLLGSQDARDGSIKIHRDVDLYRGVLNAGAALSHVIATGRGVWVQAVSGAFSVDGQEMSAGDGLAIWKEDALSIEAAADAEFLLFDMAL